MFTVRKFARKFNNGVFAAGSDENNEAANSEAVAVEDKAATSASARDDLNEAGKRRTGEDTKREMTNETEVRSHRLTGRRGKSHSRHGEHRCRKRSMESLLEKIDSLRHRNSALNRKMNINEMLSPLEMNLDDAYQHLKGEHDKLKASLEKVQDENERIRATALDVERDNSVLQEDVSLMKNLVYKLNMELEKYQTGEKEVGDLAGKEGRSNGEKLPENYEKDFVRPLLPLMRAYAGAVRQKDEIIKDLESEYKKFNAALQDVLQENEKLYDELEKKFSDSGGRLALNEVKLLKRDLEMAKKENNLLLKQIHLEREKLVKIHTTLRLKVDEVSKERENYKATMEESKADLLMLQGKYAVLKQEFDRLKADADARIPLSVHSASVHECRKLFGELKAEYENERSRLLSKVKDLEDSLSRRTREGEKWAEERNMLEKSNFSQSFEIETLVARVKELETRLTGNRENAAGSERTRQEVTGLKKQLGEANQKVGDLSRSLVTTRKKLQKAMQFAEDIVRGQETLLLQLHEKQKENNYMSAQFGNLKNQLKNVEKGAQESLNSVEEKMKNLENENEALTLENRNLENLLAAKETFIRNQLKEETPTKDSTST